MNSSKFHGAFDLSNALHLGSGDLWRDIENTNNWMMVVKAGQIWFFERFDTEHSISLNTYQHKYEITNGQTKRDQVPRIFPDCFLVGHS